MANFDHPDSIRNDVDSKTLNRVVVSKNADKDLVILLGAIGTACKLVARSVRKAGIAGLYGAAGTANTTGDDQKKLDVLSNEMFVNALYNSRVCAVLVSEEDEDAMARMAQPHLDQSCAKPGKFKRRMDHKAMRGEAEAARTPCSPSSRARAACPSRW